MLSGVYEKQEMRWFSRVKSLTLFFALLEQREQRQNGGVELVCWIDFLLGG